MYYGEDANGALWFASEMKVLADQCEKFEAFPPGYYYTPATGFVQYYKPDWYQVQNCVQEADLEKLRHSLIEATKKRLMADVPLGVLLSGGLDSSVKKWVPKWQEDRDFSGRANAAHLAKSQWAAGAKAVEKF